MLRIPLLLSRLERIALRLPVFVTSEIPTTPPPPHNGWTTAVQSNATPKYHVQSNTPCNKSPDETLKDKRMQRQVDMMISMVDSDGDGQVSFEEFHRLVIDPDPSRADFSTEPITTSNDAKDAARVSQASDNGFETDGNRPELRVL